MSYYKGDIVVCIKNDPLDERIGMAMENRWLIGEEIVVEEVKEESYGKYVYNNKNQNIRFDRVIAKKEYEALKKKILEENG